MDKIIDHSSDTLNVNSRIYYLHYILIFLNTEYKICSSIEETYCIESILGIGSDPYHHAHRNCYQFIYKSNKYLLRPLKNTDNDKIVKEFWMDSYIKKNHKILMRHNNEMNKFIIENNQGPKSQKSFYIRKIDFNMPKHVFERIIDNPDASEKEYTHTELFFICYSYAFSFLDNKNAILKNILHLIIQGKFDFNEINKEFLQFLSTTNEDSAYFQQFNVRMSEKKNEDIQFIIEEFLSNNYHYTVNDNFMKELFHWRMNLLNVFTLILQTFYFQIMTIENVLCCKIFHNSNLKTVFNILLIDIDRIMFFLPIDCKFSFESFNHDSRLLMSKIFQKRQDININMDITDFYLNLYALQREELFAKDTEFYDFMVYLFEETEKSAIIIYLNQNKISIEHNKINKVLKISDKYKTKLLSDIDILLLVSKRIMFLQYNLPNSFIKNIAQKIINDFIMQIDKNMQDISFCQYKKKQFSEKTDILGITPMSNQSSMNGNFSLPTDDLLQTISFHGQKNSRSQLIGLNYAYQVFQNFEFIGGVYESEFSLFVSNIISDCDKAQKISNFVSKIATVFKKDYLTDLTCSNENHFSESFYIQSLYDKYLVFHANKNLSQQTSIHNKMLSFRNQSKFDLKNNTYENSKLLKHVTHSSKTNSIEIYHNISSDKIYKSSHDQNFTKVFLPSINNHIFSHIFEIDNSNFHIIISRMISIKSIEKRTSSIHRKIDLFESILKIFHCDIEFLTRNFYCLGDFVFTNCRFKQNINIRADLKNENQYTLKMIDSFFQQTIFVEGIIGIQSKKKQNNLFFIQNCSQISLILQNLQLYFFYRIPDVYYYILLQNCDFISVNMNVLLIDHVLLPKNIGIYCDNLNIYQQTYTQLQNQRSFPILEIKDCQMTQNLHICGVYDMILIEKSISSFIINSFFYKLIVSDSQDEFSVINFILKAIPQRNRGFLVLDTVQFIIRNLDIDHVQNIALHSIKIFNCSIKTISNLQCKYIEIVNSHCSFQLIIATQIVEYFDGIVNLVRFDHKYMIINSV